MNKSAYKTAQFRLFVIFYFCISEKKNDCCREKTGFLNPGEGRTHCRGVNDERNRSARLGVGEGNGNPLQYSCLGNPMDGRAW